MKVIVAGCRNFTDYELLKQKLDYYRETKPITEIVSGVARGADVLGVQYAKAVDIPYKLFPADWVKNGRAAGPIRNQQMAEYADALIAVWDGESKGTKNMISCMNKLKKPVSIVWIGGPIVAQGVKPLYF